MTVTTAPEQRIPGLYPPTVQGAPGPLPFRKFLMRFVRNPLLGLPQAAFEERIVVYDSGRAVIVWVSDPALIETVLLQAADRFPKAELGEAGVRKHAGRRHSDLAGCELALAAAHRGAAVPSDRSDEPGASHERRRGGATRPLGGDARRPRAGHRP